MPSKNDCLPGRSQRIYNPDNHFVTGAPMSECMSKEKPRILFGMGCFWGAEKTVSYTHLTLPTNREV